MNKISVMEYIEDNSLLEIVYTPFNIKVDIVNTILQYTPIDQSAILKQIATDVFITSITNIDTKIKDEFDLSGYDTLIRTGYMDTLMDSIKSEYDEFMDILMLSVNDIKYKKSLDVTLYDLKNEAIRLAGILKNVDIEQWAQNFAPILESLKVLEENNNE